MEETMEHDIDRRASLNSETNSNTIDPEVHMDFIISCLIKLLTVIQDSSAEGETSLENYVTPNKSSVKLEACGPLKNQWDAKKEEDKAWLKRLIQAFISQLAKISEYEPSYSLQKHLLDLVGPQLEGNDLPLGLERQEHFASIAKSICTSLSKRKPGVDLLDLINPQKPGADKTVALIFQKNCFGSKLYPSVRIVSTERKIQIFGENLCV